MSLFSPYLVLMMPLSVPPSTSTTFPVVPAQRVHVSTSLRRSLLGSTRRTLRKPRQYIGSPDWPDWERLPLPTRFASCLKKFAGHLLPSSVHSSSIAGTRSFLSPLCAATLRNFTIPTPSMFCRYWKQTQRLFTLSCTSKSMNCSPNRGKPLSPGEKTVIYQHP